MIDDCTRLIEAQVNAKGGLSGMALKTAYRMVKSIGASYLPGAIGRLLPDVLDSLDPLWVKGLQVGQPVDYLTNNRTQAADQVLAITDKRAKYTNSVVRSSYNQLRKSIKGDVEAAVPGLASIIGAYAQTVYPAA